MAFEVRENKGALFKNNNKREGKQDADYSGQINVEGKLYWLNGWINTDKNGNKYLGVTVRPKQQQPQQQKMRVVGGSDVDPNDEIPF
jgi:hypothetical protein